MKLLDIEKNHMVHVYKSRDDLRSQYRGAVFLDRDGVIIEDVNYISSISDIKLVKGIKKLLEYFSELGVKIVIVTNQSGISREFFDWEKYEEITDKVIECLGDKVTITAIYANGYKNQLASKGWRKPEPRMIIEAANQLKIDLSRSILIGDRLSDMEAATRANIKQIFYLPGADQCEMRENISKRVDSNGYFVDNSLKARIKVLDRLEDIEMNEFIEIIK